MQRRHAVVTGGGKGIGRAAALRLAADGFAVTVLGRDRAALEATVACAPADAVMRAVPCDLTDESAVVATFAALEGVDVLVNNAGVASSAPVGRTSLDAWESTMRINATGAFLCTRAVLEHMRSSGWGRIVTVASVASHHGAPYIAAYAASKHAVLGLTRSVAAELRGSGVTANCVCPGYVRSEMTERTLANIVARTGRDLAEVERGLNVALGRLIEPEEVAAAVAYLVGDAAAAINGQSIVLDGGDSA